MNFLDMRWDQIQGYYKNNTKAKNDVAIFIAKQKLASTNQNPKSKWRREVPPLAFGVLSKTYIAIALKNLAEFNF